MDFLAELGLLDLEGGEGAVAVTSPSPSPPRRHPGEAPPSQTPAAAADGDAKVGGEHSEGEAGDGGDGGECSGPVIKCRKKQQSGDDGELGMSASSLVSSLSAASPLTLSASSLNLNVLSTAIDDLSESDTHNDSSSTCNQAQHNTSSAETPSAPQDENDLVKHVTQRMDARTNYNIFTGQIDAITGYLISGQMIYRETGEVYDGPFLTRFLTSSRDRRDEGEGNPLPESVPLRHGKNATCQYSSGMKFIGSFEYDRPKAGTWVGEGWTYEGPLVAAASEECNRGSFNASSDNNLSHAKHPLNLIGIPHPLPGSVLFHGSGMFARSDGVVYRGDFQNGLADGVGRETLPNGKGEFCGEYANGLRHGIGTLIEYHGEDRGCEQPCDCQCQVEDEGSSPDGCVSTANDTEIEATDSSPPALAECDGEQQDHGPDFAAGGTSPQAQLNQGVGDRGVASALPSGTSSGTNTPPLQQCTCQCHRRKRQTKTQRYSSGVWCAGQFEIEDSSGTVNPESKDCAEDGVTKTASGANVSNANVDSLRRSTWDNLDEKWLGI